MSDTVGVCRIGPDLVVQGQIINARRVEIAGYVEGSVSADHVVIAQGGRAYGNIRAATVEVHGEAQGDLRVRELITIGEAGSVAGQVQYGAISMAPGGILSADLKNVPPKIAGDMTLNVQRGQSVVITRGDLQAVDPDDAPEDLMFEVSRAVAGFVALTGEPTVPVTSFRQADINARKVMFVHDGSDGARAGFAVRCVDDDGASSGSALPVTVEVA